LFILYTSPSHFCLFYIPPHLIFVYFIYLPISFLFILYTSPSHFCLFYIPPHLIFVYFIYLSTSFLFILYTSPPHFCLFYISPHLIFVYFIYLLTHITSLDDFSSALTACWKSFFAFSIIFSDSGNLFWMLPSSLLNIE
jgi:hypothetical protein